MPPPPLPVSKKIFYLEVRPILTKTGLIDGTTGMMSESIDKSLVPTAPTKRKPGRPRVDRSEPYRRPSSTEPTRKAKHGSNPPSYEGLVYNPYTPGPLPKILTARKGKFRPTYTYVSEMCDNSSHQHIDPTIRNCIDINGHLVVAVTQAALDMAAASFNRPPIPSQDEKSNSGWEVLAPAVKECDLNCQSVIGSCKIHGTCSCPRASSAHMHKWQPAQHVVKD